MGGRKEILNVPRSAPVTDMLGEAALPTHGPARRQEKIVPPSDLFGEVALPTENDVKGHMLRRIRPSEEGPVRARKGELARFGTYGDPGKD